MCSRVFVIAVVSLAYVVVAGAAPMVLYVKTDAALGGEGRRWASAFRDLQDAVDAARNESSLPVDIWVAAGVYKPDRGTGDVTASFRLRGGRNVRVFGGFSGWESRLEQRDWLANETVLSGDLHDDDGPNFTNRDDNSSIIVVDGQYYSLELDGMTIRGGVARPNSGECGGITVFQASSPPLTVRNCRLTENQGGYGGAIFYHTASGSYLTIVNCQFDHNRAAYGGAAYVIRGTASDFRYCRFFENRATEAGGAIYGFSGYGMSIADCVFRSNHARRGGAIESFFTNSYSVLKLVRSRLVGNSADEAGAALDAQGAYCEVTNCTFAANVAGNAGGAISVEPVPSPPFPGRNGVLELTNCVFTGNRAGSGGALFASDMVSDRTQVVQVANSVFFANAAASSGGGVRAIGDAQLTLANSILWSNSDSGGAGESAQIARDATAPLSLDYCDIQGLTGQLGGLGNIDADPRFLDPIGRDGQAGTADDDLRLHHGSPCIDAGSNAAVSPDENDLDGDGNTSEATPLDLADYARFRDDPFTTDTGSGAPPIVDMGAYEFRPLADMNCDGALNNFDIDPFVLALIDRSAYSAAFPSCDPLNADINGDHLLNNFDIDPFVALLTGG